MEWGSAPWADVQLCDNVSQYLGDVLPPVLLDLVVQYAPCVARVNVESMQLGKLKKPRLHASLSKSRLYVRRGRHSPSWIAVDEKGAEKYSQSPEARRDTIAAYQAWPKSPLIVYSDSLFHCRLQDDTLTLVRDSSSAQWCVEQGHAAAETRLCRVFGQNPLPEFRVAKVLGSSLAVRRSFLLDGFIGFTKASKMKLPEGAWHVVGLAALPDLVLVHLATSRGKSLLVAQVGHKSPCLADSVLPALALAVNDKVLGVSNFGQSGLAVGLHCYGFVHLVRLDMVRV